MTAEVRDMIHLARHYAERAGKAEVVHRINVMLSEHENEPRICPVSAAECYVTKCTPVVPIYSDAPRGAQKPVELEYA